jgi:hypothetical protein
MTIGLGTRDPDTLKGIVKESDVHWLGEAGGGRYGRLGDREFAFTTTTMLDPGDWAQGTNGVVIRQRRTSVVDGTSVETSEYVRGSLVATGTYERLVADAAAKTRKRERARRPLPVDVLAGGPFAGRADMILPTPARASVLLGAAVPVNVGGYAKGKRPARGPAEMVKRLRQRGVELALLNGHLQVKAPGGRLSFEEREAIRAARGLLSAHLVGAPLRCELPHDGEAPEAETILAIDIPACAAHAAGEED